MSLVLTICHIIRLYKCEHCTLTYSNKITLVWFLHFFFYLGGRWFSKILRNIWGWYVKILTIPYRGGWVVWKRPKTPLRNIKMAPYAPYVRFDSRAVYNQERVVVARVRYAHKVCYHNNGFKYFLMKHSYLYAPFFEMYI